MKINQYAEAELTTVSVVNAKAVLPREMLLFMVLTAPNNYIFKERLKEVLTIKAFNSASVENFRQTKLQIEYRSVMSQKNKFVKLWDLVPFSSKASLEKGPCQKLPLNCISQPNYKG